MSEIVVSPEDLTKCFRAGQKQGIVAGIIISIGVRYVAKRSAQKTREMMKNLDTKSK